MGKLFWISNDESESINIASDHSAQSGRPEFYSVDRKAFQLQGADPEMRAALLPCIRRPAADLGLRV